MLKVKKALQLPLEPHLTELEHIGITAPIDRAKRAIFITSFKGGRRLSEQVRTLKRLESMLESEAARANFQLKVEAILGVVDIRIKLLRVGEDVQNIQRIDQMINELRDLGEQLKSDLFILQVLLFNAIVSLYKGNYTEGESLLKTVIRRATKTGNKKLMRIAEEQLHNTEERMSRMLQAVNSDPRYLRRLQQEDALDYLRVVSSIVSNI